MAQSRRSPGVKGAEAKSEVVGSGESLSNAETALLGLLAEGDKHPYQIEKDVEFRDMRVWTDLGKSNIYKLLRKLKSDGRVESTAESTSGNRLRTVYRLTKEGKRALQESVRSILTTPQTVKHPFSAGIYNSVVLSHSSSLQALTQYREKLVELVDGYGKLEEFMGGQSCPPWHLAVATRTKYLFQAELRWLDEYVKRLKSLINKQ